MATTKKVSKPKTKPKFLKSVDEVEETPKTTTSKHRVYHPVIEEYTIVKGTKYDINRIGVKRKLLEWNIDLFDSINEKKKRVKEIEIVVYMPKFILKPLNKILQAYNKYEIWFNNKFNNKCICPAIFTGDDLK